MTIITGVVGLFGRFAGKILSTTLGWATLLLFGKVPQNRQILLLGIVFGCIVWLVLVIGVIFPEVGLLLLAAAPLPDFIDETWVRLAMLIGALILPLVIGVAAALVSPDSDRSPRTLIVSGLRGYPFALVLNLIMILLAGMAIARKVRTLSRRWEDAHIPIMVKPGAENYDAVLSDVDDALSSAGLDVEPRDAGKLLSGPPKLLDAIAGRGLGEFVPDRLMILAGPEIEVLVYPSDLAVSGNKENVARARAALASRVSSAPAYLTTSAEAQEFEERLDAIRDASEQIGPAVTLQRLSSLDEHLSKLPVQYDEWEILYRLRLQLERDARRKLDGDDADDFIDTPQTSGGSPSPVRTALSVAGAGLIALDIALLIANRRNGEGKKRRQ